MSHYNVKPVEISLRPSRFLASVLSVLHMLAAGLVLLLPVPWWGGLMLILALAGSLVWHLSYQALRRLPGSVQGLKLAADGTFSVFLGGAWITAEVMGSSLVSPYLTILNLRMEGRRLPTHVVLLTDALDERDFRQLRVWLRWGKHAHLEN